MVFAKWFTYIWWGLLSALGLTVLYTRYSEISTGKLDSFDTVLLAVVSALLVLPFFSEVSILGLTFKRQIDSLKKEVREEIQSVKAQLVNVGEFTNRVSPNFYLGYSAPPSDSDLNKIEPEIRRVLRQTLEEYDFVNGATPSQNPDVPDESIFMFSVRYQIERELTRIWSGRIDLNDSRHRPLVGIIRDLVESEIIPGKLHGVMREILSVCNAGIHGETPTSKQVSFVRDVAEELIRTLRSIK